MTFEICPICRDPIEDQYQQFDCECKLFYHRECFDDLKKHNFGCPVCKRGPDVPQIFVIWARVIIATGRWILWGLMGNTESYLLGFLIFIVCVMVTICSVFALLISFSLYYYTKQYWNKFKRFCTSMTISIGSIN